MPFYDLTEYLKLSAVLNYQFIAKEVNWNGILSVMLGKNKLPGNETEILVQVLHYLYDLYGEKRRRLGSLMVLHPLRVATLLSRASDNPTLIEYITTLLHDIFEDILPAEMKPVDCMQDDQKFMSFLNKIPKGEQWFLMERLDWLTKRESESYYQYIGRLLDKSASTPEVVQAKLADRLDNTLDLRIDLEDPLHGVDFFENIFQVLFNHSYKGYIPDLPHSSITALNGAERLYQLFKNTVLMSLIRQKRTLENDAVAKEIFDNLAKASMKEAQRITLHIFAYHETDVSKLRELLKVTMDYLYQGGVDSVTVPTPASRLDGLFLSHFYDPVKENLKKKLAEFYKDKTLMVQAALAFIVIFLSFQNDPHYYVHGISPEGVQPEMARGKDIGSEKR